MKHIAFCIFLPIAAICLSFAANPDEAKPTKAETNAEPLVIAEVHNGELVPVLSDGEIKDLLEDALMAADDQEPHVFVEKVWFERHEQSHYLMTVVGNADGEKLSSAIKLEEVGLTTNASAVGIPIPVAVIPFCKSISCTNNPCPMRVWEDHIECYCIAAGECELKWRVLIIRTATAAGF